MTYIRHKIPVEVLDEVEAITGTLPGKAYYADDGEVLILADEGGYIIRITPPEVTLEGFNSGNPTTHSAYLITTPVENAMFGEEPREPADFKGWASGWDC